MWKSNEATAPRFLLLPGRVQFSLNCREVYLRLSPPIFRPSRSRWTSGKIALVSHRINFIPSRSEARVLAPPCFRKVVKYSCLINSKVSDRYLMRNKTLCNVNESSYAAPNSHYCCQSRQIWCFWYQAKKLVFFVQCTFSSILRRNDGTCRVKLLIKEENTLWVSHTYFFLLPGLFVTVGERYLLKVYEEGYVI